MGWSIRARDDHILVGELRQWRLHQDFLLNPPFSRDSSNTSNIDEDPGSAK